MRVGDRVFGNSQAIHTHSAVAICTPLPAAKTLPTLIFLLTRGTYKLQSVHATGHHLPVDSFALASFLADPFATTPTACSSNPLL